MVLGPHYKAPRPLRSAGVPPGQASWPNEFVHLSKKIFLAENVFVSLCHAMHVMATVLVMLHMTYDRGRV